VVWKPPSLDNCGHVMCRACVDKLPKQECPSCKATFSRRPLRVNYFVQNAVCQLRVKCLQHDSGCRWTGELGMDGRNLIAHDNVCPLKSVNCDLCKHSMPRTDFGAHRLNCPKSLACCCSCQWIINAEEVKQHFALPPAVELGAASAAAAAAPSADPVMRAPFFPLCSQRTDAEVCPRRCEDPLHPGHLYAYCLNQRAEHALVCPQRTVQCRLCEPPHAVLCGTLEAHVEGLMAQPAKRKFAATQIAALCAKADGNDGWEKQTKPRRD